jgi:hypothetical protein
VRAAWRFYRLFLILAFALLTSPASAEWGSGTITSNGVCNVRPVIVRCNYPDDRNPRCVGVGPPNQPPVEGQRKRAILPN